MTVAVNDLEALDVGEPSRVVQLYDVVRTAHLERAARQGGVTIIYKSRRYDFDEEMASRVAVRRMNTPAAVWFALTHPIDVLEVNEPLVESAAPRSAAVIAAVRVRKILMGGARTRVVAYAIANLQPRELVPHLPLKARVRFVVQWPFVALVWRGLDRLAIGTADAADIYEREFGARRSGPLVRQIESLPAPAETELSDHRARGVIFLGDMSDRKGFPTVLAAWQVLRARDPDARLVLVGRGERAPDAEELVSRDDRVRLLLDPPREQIFPLLAQARVLVLPSRRRPLWKEQIGLPILEGLAHGCIIVTTTETGLAGWLSAHGHMVVAEDARADTLAAAILQALDAGKAPRDVLADLPSLDGREAARRWMYASHVPAG